MNKQLNLPTCEFCKEPDCIVDHDGRCEQIRKYEKYLYLRNRDLETIKNGGVFAGMTPENIVLNGEDLDQAINKAMYL